MSIWTRIVEALAALRSRGEALSAMLASWRDPDRSVAFTIAVISLGAKMAKADGQVRAEEVRVFREIFRLSPRDEAAAARVFNLARQDVAGFDTYARRIARIFETDPILLEDVLDGLFEIALADGIYTPEEEAFLAAVAAIFGISPGVFACIEARHLTGSRRDPWQVLGVPRGADIATVRSRWRHLVRQHHPDLVLARGLPPESIALANTRIAAINAAWEEISARPRALGELPAS